MEAMYARQDEPWRAAELARLAGTSVRQLHEGFRRHLGLSPMVYLREVRLMRAHEDLVAADQGLRSVSDVAYRWGFGHPGRFAADYRRRYGQLPSDTLRRRGPQPHDLS